MRKEYSLISAVNSALQSAISGLKFLLEPDFPKNGQMLDL